MTIVYHPKYLEHVQTPGHVECPKRLEKIVEKLELEELFDNIIEPKPATTKQLERVHTSGYLELLNNYEGYLDPDTYLHKETFEIAALSAGGALTSAEFSYNKRKPSFALIRPPGHHAGPDHSGGFCYLNNIAIATEHLLEKSKKIAIIDIDIHHGNGTQEIFYKRADVLYVSTHLWGIYPGTGQKEEVGRDEGEGFNVNIPFKWGCGDSSFESAFAKIIEPIVKQFEPGMLLISFGADAHYMDMSWGLTLSTAGYLSIAERILNLAEGVCKNRCAIILEGGYGFEALAEVVAGIIARFEDKEIKLEFTEVYDKNCAGKDVIDSVINTQKRYWEL